MPPPASSRAGSRRAARLALAAALALPAPGAAQMRSIEEQRAGAWLYRTGQVRERAACILESERPAGTAGGHVRLAMLSQPFAFRLSLRDLRWRIPPGTTGLVRLEIEGGPAPYGAVLRAAQAAPDRIEVDLSAAPDSAARILAALRQGHRLTVRLPDGQVIAAPLDGTAALVDRFHDCFRRRVLPHHARRAAPPVAAPAPPEAAMPGRPGGRGAGAAAAGPRNPLAGPDAATDPRSVWR
ncbi:hypothetical protein [Caldovatus aquaticus]|uniref:Uncharacterized protein n=1 Tax=Caldovatus aquaticus TaxID=2865671 RepID=A0ABS7F1D5_9PROT|nr:hypothetical protein [Caldovatus aquaticus]MBW8269369.1 hypothetical protein [Caldovatus aquaticus]